MNKTQTARITIAVVRKFVLLQSLKYLVEQKIF
uniref:Uncharacterized protein n=1 Tax=Parascaris equorum TaxID=6256 RepID=A0A914R3N2_PAREQ